MTDAQPPPAPTWEDFAERLRLKDRTFEQIKSSGDIGAVLRACGFSDPLDVSVLETEWKHKLNSDIRPGGAESYLARAEERAREPWRAVLDTERARRDKLLADPTANVEQQRKLFLELAKAAMLTEGEAMALTYTVFGGSPADLVFFGSLLTQLSGADRVKAHNLRVAEALGEAWLATNGARLAKLTLPLFPPVEVFTALNTRLLLTLDEVAGGSEAAPFFCGSFSTLDGCAPRRPAEHSTPKALGECPRRRHTAGCV